MPHPKNKAERRKVKFKKEFIEKARDRDEAVARRLAEEALEQKEALDVLRRKVPEEESD